VNKLDCYCRTLRCKMNKEACIGRQLLAVRPERYRLDANSFLESQGFYPECYRCIRGRRLAHSRRVNISLRRRQMLDRRTEIEESPWIGFCIRRHSGSEQPA
jgi:hypothetical protein